MESTHHWKCQLAKKKELLIPPIWGCCGPTGGSIFTPGQKNHPAFSEIAAKTHSPYLANYFACVAPALKKGWMFFFPWVKNESLVGPQQSKIGGIESSFFFWPTGTSNDVCEVVFQFQMNDLRKKLTRITSSIS